MKKIGDLVYAKLGTLPVIGTVVAIDEENDKYLVHFSGIQQGWYKETVLTAYQQVK